MIDDAPEIIVIDSGPIIGTMYEEDEHHEVSVRGYRRLAAARARILISVPVMFEVYKRLAYDVGPALAHRGIEYMHASMIPVFVDAQDLRRLQILVESRPWWGGSLEDATVAMLGLTRDVPVWTFNYRDLQSFSDLTFWTPG